VRRDSTVAAIVPAAGRSERMGQPKLLVEIGGEALIGRIATALRLGGADRVLIVVPPADSAEGPLLAAAARLAGAEVIIPRHRPSQMRESIELALAVLAGELPPRWVILTPADCPAITANLVAALLEQAARQPDRMIVPVSGARRGHPIVLPWDLAAEIPRLPSGAGVNALSQQHAGRLTELAVSIPDLGDDLDTPDDLSRWLERESRARSGDGQPGRGDPLLSGGEDDGSAGPPRRMTLEVRLFAMARERAGQTTIEVELPLGARVADLRAAIVHDLPLLAPLLPKTMIAVDEEYAADDRVLAPGSRIAVIPPVSGGSPSLAKNLLAQAPRYCGAKG
jgi:molybdenum cofactor cytidylyltransferase